MIRPELDSRPKKRSCDSWDDGPDGIFIRLPPISIGNDLALYPYKLRNDPVSAMLSSLPKPDGKHLLEKAWNILKPAINIIFQDEDKSSSISYTQIQRAVMRACMTNSRETLLTMIRNECEPHVSKAIHSLENQSSDLVAVESCWRDFKRKMSLVSDLASDINNGNTLCDMGKKLFQEHLSRERHILDEVILGVLELINDERLGKTGGSNACNLKNVMDMFRGMGKVFANPLCDSAKVFYAKQAQPGDISQYLMFVERILHEEEKRCTDNCYLFCWWPLKEALESLLLKDQACVLEKGFTVLMDEGCMDDLRRMYGLFYREKLVPCMDTFVRSYIGERGASEGHLSELHTKVDKIWRRCFKQDSLLDVSIRECFEGLGLHVPMIFGYY